MRLKKLSDFLMLVDPANFFLESWQSKCMTKLCPIGWSANILEFRKDGLHLIKVGSFYAPKYLTFTHWKAVEKFFELSEKEVLFLFDSNNYLQVNPKFVAERIKIFIGEKKPKKHNNKNYEAKKALNALQLEKPTHCEECQKSTDRLERHHFGLSMATLKKLNLHGIPKNHNIQWLCVECHTKKHSDEPVFNLMKKRILQ